jgi:hypothetical protein
MKYLVGTLTLLVIWVILVMVAFAKDTGVYEDSSVTTNILFSQAWRE